jgi:hypothetical protein
MSRCSRPSRASAGHIGDRATIFPEIR